VTDDRSENGQIKRGVQNNLLVADDWHALASGIQNVTIGELSREYTAGYNHNRALETAGGKNNRFCSLNMMNWSNKAGIREDSTSSG
jgi:hypothetical protein